MQLLKVIKDYIVKSLLGGDYVPSGLVDLNKYFRDFKDIRFSFHTEDGLIVAISDNFRYGSIVTSGKNKEEVDANIKDAILTSFGVPSAYKAKAGIIEVRERENAYSLA